MLVERPVSLAQVVVCPVTASDETVFRAATPAQPQVRARPTLRVHIRLQAREIAHPGRRRQIGEGRGIDRPHQPVRLHPVIAGVHVPVELHRHVHPTRSRVHAHRRRSKHGRQGRINILDENLAHVATHPLVEHLTQETPITRRRGRTARHAVPVLAIQQRRCSGPPATFSLGQVRGAYPLHNGNELQVPCSQLVTEIAVDQRAVLLIRGVDRAQNVRLNPRAHELLPAAHHHRMSAAPAAVHPIGVVQGSGPVNRHAH